MIKTCPCTVNWTLEKVLNVLDERIRHHSANARENKSNNRESEASHFKTLALMDVRRIIEEMYVNDILIKL